MSTSSFKYLYSLVFKNNGDFSKVPDKIKKTPIKCFVKESYPYFLVGDDYFYIPCYFTKKAVDSFKSGSNTSITDLRSKVIVISDWTLELARVKSSDVFTSYGGIELKLVVNSFSVAPSKDQGIVLKRQPVNLYRDNEMKTLINHFIWSAQGKAIAGAKGDSMPDIAKLSGKGNVSQGIVKFGSGENFSDFGFKESKTSTVDVSSLGRPGGKASAKAARPTVKGGLVAKKKAISKAGKVASVVKALARSSSGKGTVGKKSTARGGKTPGRDESGKATTDMKTMAKFRKMMEWHKKQKGGRK